MSLPQFNLLPDRVGYTVDGPSATISTKLQGGFGRYRLDKLGASVRFTVQYTCDQLQYEYALAFYRTAVSMGSLPFQTGLIFDGPDLAQYTCYFGTEGLRLLSQEGLTYIIGAVLEATPVVIADPDFDNALILAYGLYGDDAAAVIAALGDLVNVDLV